KTNAGNIEQNLWTAAGSSQSSIIYPPQSPTRITNNSILKLAGAFHWVNTSRIRFWAFSYSIGEPWGRSDQVSMYFMRCFRQTAWTFRGWRSGLTPCASIGSYPMAVFHAQNVP